MTTPYSALLLFQNLEDSTQACNDLLPFYYNPPGTIRYADPDGIEFNDGTYGVQKPDKPEALAAISVPYIEVNYWDIADKRVFPPGDY